MKILQKILFYILYFLKLNKLEVKEPLITLPLDYTTALRRVVKTGHNISYKIYPAKGYLLFAKMQISKIDIKFGNIDRKYVYSSWIGDYRFTERALLKFSDEDYDFMLDAIKETLFKKENSKILKEYSFENNKFALSFNGLEQLLIKTKNRYIQEYILDQIFKLYPDQLYDLIDTIYTTHFGEYIKNYYGKLIILLFEFTDYSKLVKYFDILESNYIGDTKSDEIRKKLLEIIQKKNMIDIKNQQLR